jgi:putative oxidoreductase
VKLLIGLASSFLTKLFKKIKTMNTFQQNRSKFDEFLSQWSQAILLLVLRCYVAWQFLKSALESVRDWPGTLYLFKNEFHVPLLPPEFAAYLGTGGELVFSCLLIIGLFSRPAAIGLFFVNAMAVISYPALWEGECSAPINDHFYWGTILLVIAAFGAGRLSVDAIFKKFLKKNSQ